MCFVFRLRSQRLLLRQVLEIKTDAQCTWEKGNARSKVCLCAYRMGMSGREDKPGAVEVQGRWAARFGKDGGVG